MKFFQNSVLQKHLKNQDAEVLKTAYKKFTAYFHNTEIQQNIRDAKEEQFQEGFLRELFVNVLGYTLNPSPGFNLTSELKNEKGAKKADGAILKDGKALGVIELKGTDTKDLDKINVQAFNYKNNQTGCIYVITSNFEKLRFFIHHSVDHLEFNLFTLTESEFQLLWLCLSAGNLLNGVPLKVKEDSLLEEEKVTKQLYKDYSAFRTDLWQNMVKNSPEADRLLLFKKTQKLLDRYLFILFAEDSGLLPPNSVSRIINRWELLKDEDAYKPLYIIFNQYFGYINTGRKGKNPEGDIFAYNGGLFLPDEVLDHVVIDDEILHPHITKLTNYDFQSEIDVNILGHIFENSLNEIENITAELEGQEIDKSKTKRKKDGVFYTPKYITKYIVENTVGKLCDEKKTELEIVDEEYAKGRRNRKKETIKKLADHLQAYRNWLLQITICDPACGSGAFLNQALEFLMTEHAYIDELQAQLFGASIVFQDISNHILEQNIYGVDINEESVDIAKLSLWLRTAQRGRKLTTLNNNIKCGNSLIDDPAVAGDKAFNWQNEFPDVFAKGGFDVVIGNPPYVHLEKMKDISDALSRLSYKTFDKRGDLYCLFVEHGFNILKQNGIISFIMPNKWLQAGYGKPLREYFLNFELNQLIDFGDIQIFEGATTYPCIFVSRKAKPKEEFAVSVLSVANKDDFYANVIQTAETFRIDQFSGETWVISSGVELKLIERLKGSHKVLADFVGGEAYRGVLTGLTEAFLIDEETSRRLIAENRNANELIKPFLQGRDVKAYAMPKSISNLILIEKGFIKRRMEILPDEVDAWAWFANSYPSIAAWLNPFEERGKKRTDKGDYWWEIRACDYYDQFLLPKIMYQKFQVRPCFIYDENGVYCNDSMWIMPTKDKGLLAILNSKMGWWLINKYCTQIQNGCQLIWKYFGQIPVPNTNDALANKADQMLSLNKELQESSQKFTRNIQREYNLEKLSAKLENWFQLSFNEFLKELEKNKVKLTLSQKADWEDYFVQESKKALELKTTIDTTDREIDRMVYALYGLSNEEIQIVEQA